MTGALPARDASEMSMTSSPYESMACTPPQENRHVSFDDITKPPSGDPSSTYALSNRHRSISPPRRLCGMSLDPELQSSSSGSVYSQPEHDSKATSFEVESSSRETTTTDSHPINTSSISSPVPSTFLSNSSSSLHSQLLSPSTPLANRARINPKLARLKSHASQTAKIAARTAKLALSAEAVAAAAREHEARVEKLRALHEQKSVAHLANDARVGRERYGGGGWAGKGNTKKQELDEERVDRNNPNSTDGNGDGEPQQHDKLSTPQLQPDKQKFKRGSTERKTAPSNPSAIKRTVSIEIHTTPLQMKGKGKGWADAEDTKLEMSTKEGGSEFREPRADTEAGERDGKQKNKKNKKDKEKDKKEKEKKEKDKDKDKAKKKMWIF